MTTRLAVLLSVCLSSAALAQVPILTGTFQVLNSGGGDQIDPHVDCDLASYTDDAGGLRSIRYFDFAAGTDHLVPTTGAAHLSDVNGSRIVYTNVTAASGSQIVIFDTAASSTVVVPGGNRRSNAAIGGSLVAFEDRGFSANSNESEIVVHDLSSGSTVRLSTDALMDINPSVSPTGNAVVFQKCQTTGFGCEIYTLIRSAPGVFTTQQVTSGQGDKRSPDTNGTLVVYTSNASGEADLYYQPVGGGPATQISIPGDQRNPSISGDLIAFESQTTLGGIPEYDIFVYDIAGGILYQVTSTPGDEALNDVTVCNGAGRIVYSAPGSNGDYDVFGFTFNPPAPPPPSCEQETPDEACEDPGSRTLLAQLSVTRTTGQPDSAGASFSSEDDDVLVCVTESDATSAAVLLDGRRVVGPSAFKHQVDLIAVRVDEVQVTGQLTALIAGEPGSSYEVRVYSEPECQQGQRISPRPQWERSLEGERLTSVGHAIRMQYDLNEPLEADAMGCSTTSGLSLTALCTLALWLASRRRLLARAN